MGLAEMELMSSKDDLHSFFEERVWSMGLIKLTIVVAQVEVWHFISCSGSVRSVLNDFRQDIVKQYGGR